MRITMNTFIVAALFMNSAVSGESDYIYNVICEYKKAPQSTCTEHQETIFTAIERAADRVLDEVQLKRVEVRNEEEGQDKDEEEDSFPEDEEAESDEKDQKLFTRNKKNGKHRALGCSAYQILACEYVCGWNHILCYQVHNCDECGYRQRTLRHDSDRALSPRELQSVEEKLEIEVEAALKIEAKNDRKQNYPFKCVRALRTMVCEAHVA